MKRTERRRRWKVPRLVVLLLRPAYRRSWSRNDGEVYIFRRGGTNGRGPVLKVVQVFHQPPFIHNLKHAYYRWQFRRNYS